MSAPVSPSDNIVEHEHGEFSSISVENEAAPLWKSVPGKRITIAGDAGSRSDDCMAEPGRYGATGFTLESHQLPTELQELGIKVETWEKHMVALTKVWFLANPNPNPNNTNLLFPPSFPFNITTLAPT